jgi:MFS transporter, DHA2 family, multidrug resistance protein
VSWALTLPLRRVRRPEPPSKVSPQAVAPVAATGEPAPTLRDWFGVLAMVCGQFVAIMDVQIVTSSLTQIQGGLSASPDEISWLQTAYLIADVVTVPLSGRLANGSF